MRDMRFTQSAFLRVIAEFVMVFPLLYVISGLAIDPPMHYIFLAELCAFAALGVFLRRFIPFAALQLIIGFPLCIAIALFLGLTFGAPGQPASYLLGIILGPVIFYRGKQHAQNDWNAILPTYAPCVIMVLSLLVLAFADFAKVLDPFQAVISITGPVSLILSLFVMNSINRTNLTENRNNNKSSTSITVSKGIRQQNNILLAVITVLGILLSVSPYLARFVRMLLRWVQTALAYLLGILFDPGEEDPIPPPPMEADEQMIFDSGGELSSFWELFFKIAVTIITVLAAIGFAFLLFVILRKLIRFLVTLFRQIADQSGTFTSGGADFEDTRESILKLRDLPKKHLDNLRKRMAGRRRSPKWNELRSESERVRFLYRRSLSQAVRYGYKHRPSYTPKEALGQASRALPQIDPVQGDLTQAYDEVRYGEREPDSGTAQTLKKQGNL